MLTDRIIYSSYSPWKFNVKRTKDSFIWIDKGKKLIDFTSGWNVANLGWNNPEITQVVIQQLKKNAYVPMWSADPMQNEYATLLSKSLPKGLDAIARATGGTEANEEALKIARAYTGKKTIIGFKDAYHGQSFGTMSICSPPESVEAISPMVGGFVQINFPKMFGDDRSPKEILDEFEKTLSKVLSSGDVAAIVTEAGIITGSGSTFTAPKGYLTIVRKLTKKYGVLLVLDEVGTGFSRCGKLYGMEIEGVIPDIVTFAKGISNGAAAMGAMVTTKEIAEKSYMKAELTSTFGWTPVACAAALKTLQIHLRDKVWERSYENGRYFLEVLQKELGNDEKVADIRGIGMEIGVTFSKPGMMEKVIDKAGKKGLHLANCYNNNIQIMPPLTIDKKALQKGIEIFIDTVRGFNIY